MDEHRSGRRWLSVPEFARELGISRQRAWELASRGAVPAIASGRKLLIPRDALRELADCQAAERRARAEGAR